MPLPSLLRQFPLFRQRWMALALGLLAVLPLPLPHLHKAHAEAPASPVPETKDPAADPEALTDTEEGFSLMEEGAQLLFRGLMSQMEPSIAEIEGAFRDIAPELEALGPQLREITRLMQDVKNYQMPEMLENGDILIRRKTPLTPEERGPVAPQDLPGLRDRPLQPGPNGEIEL